MALAALALPREASAATYTDVHGHTINVEAPGLPPDPARDQAFVDVLGSLHHTDEMSGVTVHLAASPAELASICGSPTATACLNGSEITLRGWETAQQQRITLAHEYGHVIHTNRANPPRGSLSDGTKRWASYEGICQGLRSGEYNEENYFARPREAFAQAYATLHFPNAQWNFVESLRPDAGSFDAILADVYQPWAPTVETYEGRVSKRSGPATFELALPLDGILDVFVKTAKRLKAKVILIVGDQKIKGKKRLDHEVCGERAATLQVKSRRKTKGRFEVTVERP